MTSPAYYNEIDPYAAQWLRNLIDAGHLVRGDVDERSIVDVGPDDLRGYRQAHFFAGIGGWPYALGLAGWPDDQDVWTGSCPCQPLSSAGQRKGHADERHLWPAFYRLIAECRPAVVFGEQVAGKLGREWLAAVRSDLEHAGYAVGCADLPVAGVGAPHIRARLFWVADSAEQGRSEQPIGAACEDRRPAPQSRRLCDAGRLADDWSGGCDTQGTGNAGAESDQEPDRSDAPGCSRAGSVGDAGCPGLPARERDQLSGAQRLDEGRAAEQSGRAPWADLEWLTCTDGKARPTQSGLFPLAYGLPGRVGRLRAYGNAIVPEVAARFVEAAMRTRP